ncbi:ABC transporter substrate-binding protein [Microbacterium sp. A588]
MNVVRDRSVCGRWWKAGALAVAAALALTACTGTDPVVDSPSAEGPSEPVSGGTLRFVQTNEARSLDPAAFNNAQSLQGAIGNALYGSLVTNDLETYEIEYSMAESMESADGGATWILKLRPGLVFSDGTPLTAEDVKFNWERLADPATGAVHSDFAEQIADIQAADDHTLTFGLTTPQANFPQSLTYSSLNWIASPDALELGPEEFDKNPIGAGPFTLESWQRGGTMELVRNDQYFDDPRPYLDGITITTVGDANQRIDTLIAGGADLILASNAVTNAQAVAAGMVLTEVPLAGGRTLMLNSDQAPFDDPRAREALAKAIDVNVVNEAINEGLGQPVTSLFQETSPLYTGQTLTEYDPERAQELFDELAADGKPTSFAISAGATNGMWSEAVQMQLATYDNVDVSMAVADATTTYMSMLKGDYQAVTSGVIFGEPTSQTWRWLHSASTWYQGGVDDAEMDAALDASLATDDPDERRAAFEIIQERLAAVNSIIFIDRQVYDLIAAPNVGGVDAYALGSAIMDGLWIAP